MDHTAQQAVISLGFSTLGRNCLDLHKPHVVKNAKTFMPPPGDLSISNDRVKIIERSVRFVSALLNTPL